MIKYLKHMLLGAVLLLGASCVDNNVPLPVVDVQISDIRGEGFHVEKVDLGSRRVMLRLAEQTDIRNVRIDEVVLKFDTHGMEFDEAELRSKVQCSEPLTGTFDLTEPRTVTLSLYQDYTWTICALQEIDYRFSVEYQIGTSHIDAARHEVTAEVGPQADLTHLVVTELRLGPDGTAYSPALAELSGSDFSTPRTVAATYLGQTERWTIKVTRSTSAQHVALRQADAWSRVLWLYGEGVAGSEMGFAYRKAGTGEWTRVSSAAADSPVAVTGGSFKLRLSVEAETTYEVKAFCGEAESPVRTLTTEAAVQLPNSDMERWSQPKSPWLPYGEGDAPFWGSGNNGATVISPKDNLTTPVEDLHPGASGRYAARLESRYVAIKFAAGNLFTGAFARIIGTNGIVNFGRPFTLRPTALRLWVKYNRGRINNQKDIDKMPPGEEIKLGDYDQGSIFIALGTWTKEKYGYGKNHEELLATDESPICIDTRDERTFFDPSGEDVIGYGARFFDKSIREWEQITIPIDYTATDKVPTHIVVVCSSSRWGDYFTGSRDSKMWIDDIELLYD